MTPDELKERLKGKMKAITDYLAGSKVRDIIGTTAVRTKPRNKIHNLDVSFCVKNLI